MKLNNKYFLLRHGQAISNVQRILSSWPETFYNPLTAKGVKQVNTSAKKLKNICAKQDHDIDLIFASDLTRTKQTAQILGKTFDVNVKFDKRLREYSFGKFNGTFEREFDLILIDNKNRFKENILGVENYKQITKRMWSFLTDINKKYSSKNILIVSHQVPLSLLLGKIHNLSAEQIFQKYFNKEEINNAQIIEIK